MQFEASAGFAPTTEYHTTTARQCFRLFDSEVDFTQREVHVALRTLQSNSMKRRESGSEAVRSCRRRPRRDWRSAPAFARGEPPPGKPTESRYYFRPVAPPPGEGADAVFERAHPQPRREVRREVRDDPAARLGNERETPAARRTSSSRVAKSPRGGYPPYFATASRESIPRPRPRARAPDRPRPSLFDATEATARKLLVEGIADPRKLSIAGKHGEGHLDARVRFSERVGRRTPP